MTRYRLTFFSDEENKSIRVELSGSNLEEVRDFGLTLEDSLYMHLLTVGVIDDD